MRNSLKRKSAVSAAGGFARSRNFNVNLLPILAVAMVLIWPFGGGKKIMMTSSQSAPAAKGVLHLGHDSNQNTKVDMKVQYLAQPNSLTPARSVYVVWIQANGREPKNEGVLKVGKDRSGEFKTVTSYKQFEIFVTAEESPQGRVPEGERVLSADVTG